MIGSFKKFGLRRACTWLVPALALAALGACGGASASGPMIEIESPWARPALGPTGEHATHEHHSQDGDPAQPGAYSEHTEHSDHTAHGADHAAMAGHHGAGGNSAVYLVIRNRGREDDRLVGARTDVARAVELHLSVVEDGVMRMRQVDAVSVPPRGELRLQPGGYHLMLIDLARELKEGDRFDLTLDFEKSGVRVVEVVVERRG